MNKKGMAWGTIVTAIIVLVVLIVIIWIFKEQISEISEKFFQILKQTDASADEVSEGIKKLVPEK